MTADTPAIPDQAVLLRHALRVAIHSARQGEAKANVDAVRAAAELAFAPARRHGTTQQEVLLPDGTKAGLISIKRGPVTTEVDDGLLALIVAGNDPGDFEDYVLPGALSDPRVLALLSEHLPEMVSRRVRADARALYDREIEDNAGKVLDRSGALGPAGERVQVATISHGEATGEFAYKPSAKGAQMILEALELGHLTEDGEYAIPADDAAPAPAEPVADDTPPEPEPEPRQTEPAADDADERIERALSRTSARRAKATEFPPTGEQQDILDAVRTGDGVVISAGAGSGKTSSLVMIGAQEADRQGLYVAFNAAIVADAKPRFGPDVRVSTAHALAMAAVGKKYRHRLNAARVPATQVARILGINGPLRVADDRVLAPAQQARLVMETVDRFCRSADPVLSSVHVPRKPGLDTPDALAVLRSALTPWAKKAWTDLTAIHGQLRYSHDVYLKQWGLSGPQLSADYILYDEAQDADAVVQAVILAQANAQLVAVGDKAQQLYEWRGAIDAMDGFPAKHRLPLSKSFRFGPAVADEANKWLEILDADLRLTGFDQVPSVLRPLDTPDAVLCRTNAEVIAQAMRSVEAGRKTAIVGGGKDIRALADAAISLKEGRGTAHPELYAFRTWGEVQDHAENDPSGSDLKVLVSLIDANGPEKIIEVIDSLTDEKHAQVAISTAHKCVHPDTLVETPDGLVRIREIPDSGQIATPLGTRAYFGKFTKAHGPVLTLNTKRGFELTVSPEHGVTVWRGTDRRVMASDVVNGDWLRLRLGYTIDPEQAPVCPPAPSVDVRARDHFLPDRMSEELAEFIGLMVADGSIFATGKGLRLAKRYASVVDRFAVLVKGLFGYEALIGLQGSTPKAEVHSALIARWLLSIGGMAPHNKDVPAIILRSPLAMQAAFLRGLFEDGTVNRRGDTVDHIRWDNRDAAAARTVQTMLLRLGIVSTRRFHHGICSLYLYSQHAARFAADIGFVADEKTAKLAGARFGHDRHSLTPVTRDELGPLESWLDASEKQNARSRGYLSRTVAERVAQLSGSELLHERLRWHYEPIEAIVADEAETMCVTVPDGSRFLQNGFDGWNSKGREWDSVRIASDFHPPQGSELDPDGGQVSPPDARLAYVAVTRAKLALDRTGLAWVDQYLPERAAA